MSWHLLMWLWAGLFWLTGSWLYGVVPGAGPQGGEAMLAFLLLGVLGLTFFSSVNAALYASTLPGPWLRRHLRTTVLAAAASLFVLSPAVVFAGGAIADGETPAAKWGAVAAYVALLLAWYALNLIALGRVRRARGGD